MTRLTNELRESIVSKIMAKVPVIDYRSQIGALLNETARANAPAEIMALHGTPAWRYVSTAKVYISGDGYFSVCPLPDSNSDTAQPNHPDHAWRMIYETVSNAGLIGATKRQKEARDAMRHKLMQVMKQTTTINGLRKVLSPDLHQFVPVDVDQSSNLPVPAVVEELKAMGMVFDKLEDAE